MRNHFTIFRDSGVILRVKKEPRLDLLVLEKCIRLVALTVMVLPGALAGAVGPVSSPAALVTVAAVPGAPAASLIDPTEEATIAAVPDVVVAGRRLAGWARLVRIALVVSLILEIGADEAPGRLIQGGGNQSRIHRQGREVEAPHQGIRHTVTPAPAAVLARDPQRLEVWHVQVAPATRVVPAVGRHIVARVAHVAIALVVAVHTVLHSTVQATSTHVRIKVTVHAAIVGLGLGGRIGYVNGDALDDVVFAAEGLSHLRIEKGHERKGSEGLGDKDVGYLAEFRKVLAQIVGREIFGTATYEHFAGHLLDHALLK